MKNHLLYLLFSLALLSSCNTSKEIIYFQDVEVNSPKAVAPPQDITVQPKDQISIIVSSKDPELAALFNLTRVHRLEVIVLAAQEGAGTAYPAARRPAPKGRFARFAERLTATWMRIITPTLSISTQRRRQRLPGAISSIGTVKTAASILPMPQLPKKSNRQIP